MKVIAIEVLRDWFLSLDDSDADVVEKMVARLEAFGVRLTHAYLRKLTDELWELRHGGTVRVVFAIDGGGPAVLLVGGDMSGIPSAQFYADIISKAEKLWEEYQR